MRRPREGAINLEIDKYVIVVELFVIWITNLQCTGLFSSEHNLKNILSTDSS